MFQSTRLGLVLGAIGFGALMALGALPASAAVFGEPVSFDSVVYPPTAFKVKKAEEQGIILESKKGATITGNLYRPDGAGTFPAVILMHGCGGIGLWNRVWRQRLVDWGYVVLDMDSFSPRGIEHGVCYSSDVAGPLSRALDAYGARAFLTTLPFVAPNHVAVMGMSHGGNSVLKAIDSPISAKVGVEPFQAAVALYPNCDPNTEPNTPVLILTGALDNVLDQTDCPRYLAKFGPDHDVILKVYPGAHHIFDIPDVDTLWRGHFVLRYHAEAAEDAELRIRAFLAKHLQ